MHDHSALLEKIMERAETIRKSHDCPSLTRDFIVVAAISVMDEAEDAQNRKDEEFQKTRSLLENLSRERTLLAETLEKWRGKASTMETYAISARKGTSLRIARERTRPKLRFKEPSLVAGHYMEQLRHADTEEVILLLVMLLLSADGAGIGTLLLGLILLAGRGD